MTGSRAFHPSHSNVRTSGALQFLAGVMLVVCVLAGGSSRETNVVLLTSQVLALPLILWSITSLGSQDRLWQARAGLAVVLAIIALPMLQLLPVPEWLWRMSPERVALLDELGRAGVGALDYRWSLSPAATEQNLYVLLPPVALFLVALSSDARAWRVWLWGVVGMAVFSMMLGFVQLGLPQDSFFKPFPNAGDHLTGVFSNKNHQASLLAIGLVLVLALTGDVAATRFDRGRRSRIARWVLVPSFILVLPLVHSRAGVIIALLVSGVVLLLTGPMAIRRWRESHFTRAWALIAVASVVLGTLAAWGWMQNEVELENDRWTTMLATAKLAVAHSPLGSGFGTFVATFEQGTAGALMQQGYINNAHNDYLQWWYEGGVLTVGVVLAGLIVLWRSVHRLFRSPDASQSRAGGLAATAGLLVLLFHSTVDYPLRTPALMTVAGLLAGIVIASALPKRNSAHHVKRAHGRGAQTGSAEGARSSVSFPMPIESN